MAAPAGPSGIPGAEIPDRIADAPAPEPILTEPAPAVSTPTQPTAATDPALLAVLDRNNRLLDAIITRPPPTTAEPREPELSASPPDPITDPQGHAKWVDQRISRAEKSADRKIAESRAEIQNQQAMAELWQDFQREHPDESRLPELVMRALETETAGTFKISGDTSALKTRVAERVRERLVIARGGATVPSPTPATTTPAVTPPNRTAGITGGSAPPAPATPKAPEKIKSFTEQIKEAQLKSPYF